MAEPRRVAFISLSPVRRREADYPGAEREPEYPREPPRLEPQPYREPARAEQPTPREAAPRSDVQPPPREKPLPQREVSRAEPPMSLQREPPRPEPPPPPLPQLHLQPPPPRETASRAEPQQRPPRETVRLELVLKDPTDESCVEFSYPELLLCGEQRVQKIPPSPPRPWESQDASASPSGWHLPTPTLRVSGLLGGWAGGGRGREGGRVVGAAFPCSPGLAKAPTRLRRPPPRSPAPNAARSRFSSAAFGTSEFMFLSAPHTKSGSSASYVVGFSLWSSSSHSGRKEEKTLGDTPPGRKPRDSVTPRHRPLHSYVWL